MNSFALDDIQNQNGFNNHSEKNAQTAQATTQQPKRKDVRQIVFKFFNYTTINGFQRLASAKTIIGRLFWIIVLLGALTMFSKDIYSLINQYLERPVRVVSKINYFKKMNFPAVTVCNVNPIRIEKVSDDDDLKVDGLSERIHVRKNNKCFKEDLRKGDNDCEEEEDEDDKFNDGILFLLANTNETILRKNGHQFRDFIVSCRYAGIRCRNSIYWTQFWDPKYGNCYSFNSRLTGYDPDIPLFMTRKPGSSDGLKLTFNIEIEEYIPEITQDAGVKIIITPPNEMPFPLYQSLSLAPGFKTDIALKKVNIKRVDRFNNGSCQENKHLSENNQYRKKYNASYNVQACLQDCYSKSQIRTCGCAEYAYLTAAGKVCDETDGKTEKCLQNWNEASGTCDESCRDPCQETFYESSVSFTKWPSSQSKEIVFESLGVNDDDEDAEEVKKNFLAANIFFQRFRETKIEESLSYEIANLLADIGGQIGFWAGLSMVSMCELLELFALLLRSILQGRNESSSSVN